MKTILFCLIFLSSYSNAVETYYYTEVSIGHFFDGDYDDKDNPDGQLPATISVGKAWVGGVMDLAVEFRHRSNLDIGIPFSHDEEYSRNGVFIRLRHKWN